MFRGRDAAEAWQGFVAERLPALQALGWRNQIDTAFGPRLVDRVGLCDMRVSDAPQGSAQGSFSLDFGIELDGARHPLLPILMRLRERGGMAAARVIDGEVVTSLEDGRILKLPAERIARLLAVMDDLVEAAARSTGETMVLDGAAAPAVLDLEDLVTTRWQDGAMIIEQVARFRATSDIPQATVPAAFTASLRPYQQLGVNWLQHLRANSLGGLLADDMGLGKTAQTIAHIAIEEDAGRLDRPVLVVVPTSLVPNWTAELNRFAPHLRVAVLHGLARHEKRRDLTGVHVVITTYTVLYARHRGHGRTAVAHGGAGRGPGDQKPRRESNACGLPARNPPSAVSVGDADREQPRRAMVAIRVSDAGPAGIAQKLQPPVPCADREGWRPGAARAVGDTHQAVHPAADEVGGGN